MRDVCIRSCTIRVDVVGASGEAGPDGVEDPGATSDCEPAGVYDGPAGAGYRCVVFSDPSTAPLAYCLPGTTFAECNSSADCPGGEVCALSRISADVRLRCGAPYRENVGWSGAVVQLGDACNDDVGSGALAYCAPGPCTGGYCSAFCTTDADCDTTPFNPGQRCSTGRCDNDVARTCTVDSDCSTATCSVPYDLSSLGGPMLTVCGPRS